MRSKLARLLHCVFVLSAFGCLAIHSSITMAADGLSAEAGHDDPHHASSDLHAEGGHAAAADPDPLIIDVDLAIWTLIVFLVVLAVLWKFAWGPIVDALEHREQHISDHIAGAERANEDAKRNLADYETKLAEAANEVREMIEEARQDADHTRQEIVADAKREAGAERDRALRDIETAKGTALKELAENSANLAVDLAGKIIQEKLKPEDHSALIRKAVDGFPAGSPSDN
jgi:F-type H+-transporting ATPase subunit b